MKHVFYRYMGSHGLETLKTCWFMVSKPSKFRAREWSRTAPPDDTECMPQLGGDGHDEFPLLGHSRNVYAKEFNAVFSCPETIDCVVRILCLCDPEKSCDPIKNLETDVYMWQHYAANFEGLRIGIELDVDDKGICNMPYRFRGEYVEYCEGSNLIHASKVGTCDDLSECCFNVLYRKSASFNIESEYRLITDNRLWKTRDGLSFLPLDKSMIVSVDVGQKMLKSDVEELRTYCKKSFELRRFAQARMVDGRIEYGELG